MNHKSCIILFLFIPITVNAQVTNPLLQEANEAIEYAEGRSVSEFARESREKLIAFRDSVNTDYAKFLEQSWNTATFKGMALKLRDDEISPIQGGNDKKDATISRPIRGEVVLFEQDHQPQPKSIIPIEENNETSDYCPFLFYGTEMRVRWGDASKFKFKDINNKELAKAYRLFSGKQYTNLLHDCLDLRDKYTLCDWAYYKMLESMTATAFGGKCNEATFLQGVLYGQSGYMMRFAVDSQNRRLHLLCKMTGNACYNAQYDANGIIFHLLEDSKPEHLFFCNKAYYGEQEMSMDINHLPKLATDLTDERIIKARNYPIVIKSKVNKNIIDFFNDYPSSNKGDNFMTRWAYYANTPISKEVKNILYPQLESQIKGLSTIQAVKTLLNWIWPPRQSEMQLPEFENIGLPYGYDNVEWGYDRAFFAEETLYYRYSDCEDHAILFSHLVRDLLGLDVVLVYYPNHLATAICFKEDIKGDYIMVNGRKFIIADPTYTNGGLGVTMPECEGKETKVILCKRLNYD